MKNLICSSAVGHDDPFDDGILLKSQEEMQQRRAHEKRECRRCGEDLSSE